MQFRPLPILTLFTIAALGLLCWLGSWQYERAAQKAADIDAFHARSDMPVQDVESAFPQFLLEKFAVL